MRLIAMTRWLIVAALWLVASGCNSLVPPSDKQAIQDAIDRAQASGLQAPAPKGQGNPNPTDEVEIIAPEGGIPAGAGLLFLGSFMSRPPTDKEDIFTSSWSVIGATQNIDIWAGARGAAPAQGFVMVVVWDATRTRIIGGGSYDAPKRHGALTITGAKNTVLTLQAKDGSKSRFDAVRQVFH